MKLVATLPDKVRIYRDLRNWILEVGGVNSRFYFPELDQLCDDLLNLRLKVVVGEPKRIKTDLRSLVNAVEDAREAVRRDIDRLRKIVTKRDTGSKTRFSREEVHG